MVSWDDGKHKNVKKIEIKYGSGKVNSIKVAYESDGKPFPAPKRGGNGGGQFAQIDLDKGEYLIAVTGYYSETDQGEVITLLKFQTNRRTFGPYGTKTRNYFSIYVPKDNQILGFYGSSGQFLSSLDTHIGPVTAGSDAGESKPDDFVTLKAQGGEGGIIWDDGVYDNVRKIYVGQGADCVTYVKLVYDKGGQAVEKEHGKRTLLEPEEFEIKDPDDYLVRVEVYYDRIIGYNHEVIQSIRFVTKKGKESPQFGMEGNTRFTLENNGSKIIGFHGRADKVLYSLGAYAEKSATPLTPAVKKPAAGSGSGGNQSLGASVKPVTK